MVAPQNETTVLRDAHATTDAIERIRAAGAMDARTIVEGNARTGELVGDRVHCAGAGHELLHATAAGPTPPTTPRSRQSPPCSLTRRSPSAAMT